MSDLIATKYTIVKIREGLVKPFMHFIKISYLNKIRFLTPKKHVKNARIVGGMIVSAESTSLLNLLESFYHFITRSLLHNF